MTKNFYLAVSILVVIIGLSTLFVLQQKSIKNPLDNNQTVQTIPSAKSVPTPTVTPSLAPSASLQPEPTITSQTSTVSGNMVTMPDGLQIQDISIGTGNQVKTGDTVAVNYLGTLENGTKFDSSYDRNQPFVTQIGVGQVIKGWDEGIIGMKIGGKRKLIVPPNLGYGAQAVGTIPANSILIFEVQLVAIK
jgi:peptidylprolyl isomerase